MLTKFNFETRQANMILWFTGLSMSDKPDEWNSCFSCEGVSEEECTEQITCDQTEGKQVPYNL